MNSAKLFDQANKKIKFSPVRVDSNYMAFRRPIVPGRAGGHRNGNEEERYLYNAAKDLLAFI